MDSLGREAQVQNGYSPSDQIRDERVETGKKLAAKRMTGPIGQIAKRVLGMFATRRGRHRQYKKMGQAYFKEANHQFVKDRLGTIDARKERVLRQAGFIPKNFQINSLEHQEDVQKHQEDVQKHQEYMQLLNSLDEASERYDAHRAIKNGELDWVKNLDNKGFQDTVRALKKMDTKEILLTPQLATQVENYNRLANMAKGKDTELVKDCINKVNLKTPLNDEALAQLAQTIKEKETANIVPNALKELDGLDDDLKNALEKVLQKVAEPAIKSQQSEWAKRDVKQVVDAIEKKRKQLGAEEFDEALKRDPMWQVEMQYLDTGSISAGAVVSIVQAVRLGS